MKLEHLAIWVDDLEKMRQFYSTYFDAVSGANTPMRRKDSVSYFLTIGEGEARLELMTSVNVDDKPKKRGFMKGLAHFAISGWEQGSSEQTN